MADNIAVTPGTGASIAADDIGGILFQRVKIGVGADGSATDLSSANPMPIGAPPSLPLPSGASSEATLAALNAKVTYVNTGAVTVSASALPIGASTEATLAAASAKLPGSLGQKAMAASVAVVVASDQSAIPATISASATVGGLTPYANLDLGVTGQVVKSSAGQLLGWYLYNNSGGVRYVKVYDKATAATSLDTPVMTIPLPASAGANIAFAAGIQFANGISIRGTTGVAVNDVGAPTTNDLVVNFFFK